MNQPTSGTSSAGGLPPPASGCNSYRRFAGWKEKTDPILDGRSPSRGRRPVSGLRKTHCRDAAFAMQQFCPQFGGNRRNEARSGASEKVEGRVENTLDTLHIVQRGMVAIFPYCPAASPFGRFLPELGPCLCTALFFAARNGVEPQFSALGECVVGLPEAELHDHAVDPAAQLEPDRAQQRRALEAEALMQPDRGAVARVADDRDHLSHA